MQHVDEGRLHAWLDGELPDEERAVERHLEDCEACRARADEERRIRSAASSILLGADPGEIAMRRMVTVPAARRPRPWVAVGWAASVLLALGIGWMARPAEREPVAIAPEPAPAPAPPRARTVTVPEATQSATGVAASPVEPTAQPAADRVARSGPAREERVAQLDAAPVAEAAAESPAESAPVQVPEPVAVAMEPIPEMIPQAAPLPPPPPPASPPPPSPPLASAPPAARRGRSASEAPVSSSPPPPAMERVYAIEPPPVVSPPPLAAEVANETVMLRGRVTGAESGAALAGVQVSVPALKASTVTRADGSYDLALPAERLAASDTIRVHATVVGRAAQSRVVAAESETANFTLRAQAVGLEGIVATRDAAGWRRSARADAERHLRYPLVIVPGLEVLGIEVGRVDGRTAVRVRQRLPGGETLTLTQRRAPARAATPAEGIAIRKGRLLVEATAPIPQDSLRKLF